MTEATDKKIMPAHPAANAFPMMDDDRLGDLIDDIEANGQKVPIVVCDGMVLDGRNRYKACLALGVEPRVEEYDGNPWDYVWSLNGARRDIDAIQRAIIKGIIDKESGEWERIRAEAVGRRRDLNELLNRGEVSVHDEPKPVNVSTPGRDAHPSRAARAKAANVSQGTQARAELIINNDPELASMVASGKVKSSEALKEIKRRKVEEYKSEIAAQVREAPDAPQYTVSDWREWLPQQDQCDLLLTDPPYSTDVDDIGAFAAGWLPAALDRVKPTGRAYIFVGGYPAELAAYLSVAMPEQILVWSYKNTMGPAPTHRYKMNWQAVLYYIGKDAPRLDCKLLTEHFAAQEISTPSYRYHAWQKPDKIAEQFVRHATKPGDLVLDPFCCTGTFIIAASKLGRVGRGCDIDGAASAIARERGCVIV